MKMRTLALSIAVDHRGLVVCTGVHRCFRASQGTVFPLPGLPHRRLRAQRCALRQRHGRLHEAGECPRRHQRRDDLAGRMRNRLRHRPWCGMLRAPEGQERRRHRVPAAVHRHHLRADRKSPGRQDPADHRRLRPQRIGRRWRLQVELPPGRHLLGGRRHHHPGHRQTKPAAWTSSRARRSRWSTTTARSAKSRSRCCKSAPPCTASR